MLLGAQDSVSRRSNVVSGRSDTDAGTLNVLKESPDLCPFDAAAVVIGRVLSD